jgi:serine/threonine protein kinase
VGVAHLDIKPTNVVMRQGKEPVLVDFGLAGRHLRLGCGTGPYGSPEIWSLSAEQAERVSPTPADVYAAACLTYETLTTQPLFDQESEVNLIAAHMGHDGWPTPLRSWYQQKELATLAQLVGQGLRRDPRDRIDIARFRRYLAELAPKLAELPWPLSP